MLEPQGDGYDMVRRWVKDLELPLGRVLRRYFVACEGDPVAWRGETKPIEGQGETEAPGLDVGFLQGPGPEEASPKPRWFKVEERSLLVVGKHGLGDLQWLVDATRVFGIHPAVCTPGHQTSHDPGGVRQAEAQRPTCDFGPTVLIDFQQQVLWRHGHVGGQHAPHKGVRRQEELSVFGPQISLVAYTLRGIEQLFPMGRRGLGEP